MFSGIIEFIKRVEDKRQMHSFVMSLINSKLQDYEC